MLRNVHSPADCRVNPRGTPSFTFRRTLRGQMNAGRNAINTTIGGSDSTLLCFMSWKAAVTRGGRPMGGWEGVEGGRGDKKKGETRREMRVAGGKGGERREAYLRQEKGAWKRE